MSTHILVFKTNITSDTDRSILRELMPNIKDIIKWNIDVWDIDNVLRIESDNDCSDTIIQHINQAGYSCLPLED
jgi:hypothetical protein